jgi:hypothetical protein
MLQSLDADTLALFDEIPDLTIDLKGNPFVCDSYLDGFLRWMKKTQVTLRQRIDYVCKDGRPSSNIGRPLDDVLITDVHPATLAIVQRTADASHTAATVMVTLLIVGILLGLATAYRNRKMLATKIAPEWRSIVSKLHYTSLVEPEPAPEAL